MHSVLLTGFGLWPDVTYNPTAPVVHALDGAVLSGKAYGPPALGKVHGVVLDVSWGEGRALDGRVVHAADSVLRAAVDRARPDIVLSLGLAPDSDRRYVLERQVLDERNQTSGDVRGRRAPTSRAHPKAPRALDTTFQIGVLVDYLERAGFVAEESENGAGKFLCEAIAYEGALLARAKKRHIVFTGFMHVPNPLYGVPLSERTDLRTASAEVKARVTDGEAKTRQAVTIVIEGCLAALHGREWKAWSESLP